MTIDGSEQMYFKLCSDHLSIEAIPRRRTKVDFARIRESPSPEYQLLMWTPHFAIVRNQGGQEITVREDGRMLIRNADSEAVARQAAADMLGLIQRDFGPDS